MGNKWITKEEVERIIQLYKETELKDGRGSILKTAKALKISTVKVRRVLITEGLWSSRSSKEIGKCRAAGMSTAEIAEKLHMTEKNVQAYMSYEGGVYGEESQNAVDSRRSRDKARGKEEKETDEMNIENDIHNEEEKETDTHHMMKYAVDYGKMLFLLDDICDKVNELPVVREEAIDLVRAYEKELYEEWNKDYKYVESPDPFDYPLVVKSEEDKRKMEEYNRLEAAAEKAHRANPYHSFIYIDCAPEALNYASPGMPESDYWLYPELLEKAQAKDKSRRMKKLTYSQFIDRFSTCISGRRLDGSAYEKTLQTQSV